jgi:hypothetical protein
MVWRLLVQAFSFLYALSFYMRFLFICAFSLYALSRLRMCFLAISKVPSSGGFSCAEISFLHSIEADVRYMGSGRRGFKR